MSRWARFFSRRKRMMEDLDQDIRDYIERGTQDNIERGMPAEEARYAALRKFGNVARVKEDTWEVWSFVRLEQIWQDVRFGLRMLAKNPGFTLFVAGLLALGIGSTTVIFSLFDAVFLRPLPVQKPTELVRMVQYRPKLRPFSLFPYAYYEALWDHSATLAAAFGEAGDYLDFAMSDPEPPEQISVYGVTPEFFTALGARALYGRVLLSSDARDRADMPPAVVSYEFWQRRFGGDPGVVNKQTLLINGHRFVIVGVMPRDFNGTTVDTAPDVRIPLSALILLGGFHKDRLNLEVAGRLKSGVARSQAQAECLALWRPVMESTLRNVYKSSPQAIANELSRGMAVEPIARGVSLLRDRYGEVLKMLMVSIAVLLLIVCTNVAGLLLERAAARQQEITVRLAVGASRFRLIWQLLAENAPLAILGIIGGLAVTFVGLRLAPRALPPIRAYPSPSLVPLSLNLAVNWRVFVFLVLVSLATTLLFSLSPALAVWRSNLEGMLRAGRSSTGMRGRQVLIVLQVSLCTFSLITASLFVHTVQQLRQVNPGFDGNHIATFTVYANGYKSDIAAFLKAFTERVRALPGVQSVAVSSMGVMRGVGTVVTVAPAGERSTPAEFLNTTTSTVSPEYFATMGMHILAGRGFTLRDVPHTNPAGPVATVVSEAFVRKFFPNTQPLGKLYGWAAPGEVAGGQYEIVGVVSDTKYRSLRAPVVPISYLCQTTFDRFVLNVRTRMRPEAIIAPVRKALASLDPGLPIVEAHTMAEEVEISMASERVAAELASMFGGIAALLVGVGIYGLLAFLITQRRREIGIRMALGATRDDVLKLVVGQGMNLTLMGLGIGIAGALGLTRFLSSLLYGIKPSNPLTLIAASLLLVVVALVACYLPARRATKVDPMVALRHE
jgi:predicted permease